MDVPYQAYLAWFYMIAWATGPEVARWRELNTQCLACELPADASKEKRYWAERRDASARSIAKIELGAKVRPGGEWDLKPIIQRTGNPKLESTYWTRLESNGPEYYYDAWGNLNFGFVAMAGGFAGDDALDGAGTAQFVTDLLRGKRPQRVPGVTGNRAYDHAADQIGIQLGFELWATYGLDVTPQDIVEAVKRSPGLTTR